MSLRLAILACCFATPALAGPVMTPITAAGAGDGRERCATASACPSGGTYGGLSSIIRLYARSQGATLTRLSDGEDQVWSALPDAGVFGFGRSAHDDSTFGVIPGLTGGSFSQVLGTIGAPNAAALYLPGAFISSLSKAERAPGDIQTSSAPGLGQYTTGGAPVFTALQTTGLFRFAINDQHSNLVLSTRDADNAGFEDGTARDHAVTWELNSAALTKSGERQFVVSFEDAPFTAGSDGDYNDYTFAVRNVRPTGHNAAATRVPEPMTVALVAAGLVGLGIARRRHAPPT